MVPGEFIPILTVSAAQGSLELPPQYFEGVRLSSFAAWPKEDIVSGRKLAQVGFQYLGMYCLYAMPCIKHREDYRVYLSTSGTYRPT